MNQKNYTNTIYKTIYSVLFLASLSIFARAQSSSTNIMSLKGEDFPVEKKLPLFCDTIISCWTIHEGNKKTIFIQLVGMLDNKKTQLQIEVPAKAEALLFSTNSEDIYFPDNPKENDLPPHAYPKLIVMSFLALIVVSVPLVSL